MTTKNTYGSFNVTSNGNTFTANPLTQQELADGWQLVVPRVRREQYVVTNTTTNKTFTQYKKNYKLFRINMAQLPEHLWCKMRPIYEEGILSHYIAKDGMYLYIVNTTPVDKEIRELYSYITSENLNSGDLDRINELRSILSDNNVKGWLTIRNRN